MATVTGRHAAKMPAYDQTLYSTWNLSYPHIQRQSPIAAMLLQQWAYFASEDLWYELLEDGDWERPEWLKELTENKLTFHACLRILCSHGLVEAAPTTASECVESRGYSVHGCVHSCTCRRSLETMREIGAKDEASWCSHFLGDLFMDRGRLQVAEAMYEQAFKGYEQACGNEHTSILDIFNNLGLLYTDQGRHQEAEAMFKRALEGYEKACGREHTSTLNVVSNLYTDQGLLEEAEAIYKRALEGYEKAFSATSILTYIPAINTTKNLGLLCEDKGNVDSALLYYQRAREGAEAVWGQDSARYTWLSSKLSSLRCKTSEVSGVEVSLQSQQKRETKWKRLRAKLSGMYKPR